MTNLISSLRTRSRAVATALLGVLLASWLSMLCPDCVAQAAEPPASNSHCHSDPAPAPQSTDHDCCDQVVVAPCAGADCAELTPVTLSSTDTLTVAAPQFEALAADVFEILNVAPPAVAAALPAQPIAAVSCPLYLRHCVFLN